MNTNNSTVESNKLIAEILGFKIDEETENYLIPILFAKIGDFKEWADTRYIDGIVYYLISENELCFNFDWNWLMFVIEKIESLGFATSIVSGSKGFACVITNGVENSFLSNNKTSNTKIEAVYKACVEFIKWYNENK